MEVRMESGSFSMSDDIMIVVEVQDVASTLKKAFVVDG